MFGVAASTYYSWIAQDRNPSLRCRTDIELLAEIREIHGRSGATYGAPRVHATLHRRGHRVSPQAGGAADARSRAAGRVPAQALLAYTSAFATGLTEVWGRAAASLAVAALDDPEQRRAQQVFVTGYRTDLAALVSAAVNRAEIPRPVDPDSALDRLVASLIYRYLFLPAPLDDKFVHREVQHTLHHLGATATAGRTAQPS